MSGNNLQILPVLDNEVLKEKAQAAAMKGAEEAIKEYYTGYRSPFIEAITEELKKQQPGLFLQLPDILSLINDSLSKQIDQIANKAVATTFVPLVNKILTRAEMDVKFSEVLKQFVSLFEHDGKHPEDFDISIDEDYKWGWLRIKLSCDNKEYQFTLHKDSIKSGEQQTYSLCGLPYEYGSERFTQKMKLTIDNASLELPFVSDVLHDDFLSYCAKLILSESNIHMDTKEFQDWMFPQDGCHCH